MMITWVGGKEVMLGGWGWGSFSIVKKLVPERMGLGERRFLHGGIDDLGECGQTRMV